ncbi:hypothetical protein Kpol_1054p30 [Vanderwaltozyma polyspora DSM 70294]|uniref:Uncharacterized protein n=1 Tax=Vanderwaltozyma polyspora (strain ATCC 22028 / DSM 70294 / BCRC 21397 / CBS 2163 / NBRC 10782 / NRRL Y-8283 / UCD 57-17) TaxID=436907 RepID=A7TIB7_VANPO|nr:uncharacterized protein Kpol_1054p30 [Vanderwaltozyma polyspora DSM 70294]EDO17983.1 hypothetical protein Kpol_1054p30 [Vanderwaltozyma polyspora DSM 70294]
MISPTTTSNTIENKTSPQPDDTSNVSYRSFSSSGGSSGHFSFSDADNAATKGSVDQSCLFTPETVDEQNLKPVDNYVWIPSEINIEEFLRFNNAAAAAVTTTATDAANRVMSRDLSILSNSSPGSTNTAKTTKSNRGRKRKNSSSIKKTANPRCKIDYAKITAQIQLNYDALLTERNKRIKSLEKELDTQRREVDTLKRLLLEDVGSIRSILAELRN